MLRFKLKVLPGNYATQEDFSEDLFIEVSDIVDTLKDLQCKLKAGETVDDIDDDMANDILDLDFSNIQISFALATDGYTTLFVR